MSARRPAAVLPLTGLALVALGCATVTGSYWRDESRNTTTRVLAHVARSGTTHTYSVTARPSDATSSELAVAVSETTQTRTWNGRQDVTVVRRRKYNTTKDFFTGRKRSAATRIRNTDTSQGGIYYPSAPDYVAPARVSQAVGIKVSVHSSTLQWRQSDGTYDRSVMLTTDRSGKARVSFRGSAYWARTRRESARAYVAGHSCGSLRGNALEHVLEYVAERVLSANETVSVRTIASTPTSTNVEVKNARETITVSGYRAANLDVREAVRDYVRKGVNPLIRDVCFEVRDIDSHAALHDAVVKAYVVAPEPRALLSSEIGGEWLDVAVREVKSYVRGDVSHGALRGAFTITMPVASAGVRIEADRTGYMPYKGTLRATSSSSSVKIPLQSVSGFIDTKLRARIRTLSVRVCDNMTHAPAYGAKVELEIHSRSANELMAMSVPRVAAEKIKSLARRYASAAHKAVYKGAEIQQEVHADDTNVVLKVSCTGYKSLTQRFQFDERAPRVTVYLVEYGEAGSSSLRTTKR